MMDGTVNQEENVNSGFVFCLNSHRSHLLEGLQELRQTQQFTDVVLQVEDSDFYCHRNILVSASTYFKGMFSNNMRESRENLISIQGIKAIGMDLILDFVYTSKVQITPANVQPLLEAADLLHIQPVQEACVTYLARQLDITNCFGIYTFAERHSCLALSRKAWTFALVNFTEVCKQSEILEQPQDLLERYLSSDDLVVEAEEEVYKTIMKWAEADIAHREVYIPQLWSHIRPHLMSHRYLKEPLVSIELLRNVGAPEELISRTSGKYQFTGTILRRRATKTRSRNLVVVVGGIGPGNLKLKDLKCYDPIERKWSTLTQLPNSVDSVGSMAVVDNNICVTGLNGKVWLYLTGEDIWLELTTMGSKKRQRHASASFNGLVYLVGGYDGTSRLAVVDRFNPSTRQWQEVTPLPEAVSTPAAAVHEGMLYVIGGALSDEMATDKVHCYSPETNTWSRRAPIPHALSGISAVVLTEYIYVVGCLSQIVYRYCPATDNWGQIESMSNTRALCSATVCCDKIYVTGGENQPNNPIDSVECYDPVIKRWTPCYSLPYPMKLHGCVTVRKRLKIGNSVDVIL